MIRCNEQTGRNCSIQLSLIYCVTYDHETEETVIGPRSYQTLNDMIYHRLPVSEKELNSLCVVGSTGQGLYVDSVKATIVHLCCHNNIII